MNKFRILNRWFILAMIIGGWSFSFSQAAQSTYSGGSNHGDQTKGAVGPFNLGDRAQFGSIQLRGNQEFTYDSNLYLANTGTTNDWASITTPGIVYKIGTAKNNLLEVGYDVNVIRYFTQTQENGEEHLPYLHSLFTLGSTKLTVDDSMLFVKGGTSRGTGNEVTQRVLRMTNDGRIGTETQLDDKLALGAHVHDYLYRPSGIGLEHNTTDGGFTVFYKAFAKLDLYIENDGGQTDVTHGGRQDFYQTRIGFRGDLTPKLVGKFDAGWEYRTSTVPGVADRVTPILSGSLTESFTDDVRAILRADRSVDVSLDTPGQTITTSTVGFNLSYQFGPVLNQDLKTRKLALGLDYSYANSAFQVAAAGQPAQNLDIHTVEPSLEYRIQDFWKVYLLYHYQNLSSNITGGNYQDQRVSIGTAVLF